MPLPDVPIITPPAIAAPAPQQTSVEALVQDAREYARANGVTLSDALNRLRAQEESLAVTDAIRQTYRDRLAGIAIEHQPGYRIVVLLTGIEPVPDQSVDAGGISVPIIFRTGATATVDQLLTALDAHRGDIRAAVSAPPGMGIDPRTGELVVMVKAADVEVGGADTLNARLAAIAGVPVRVRVLDRPDRNMDAEGGSRVEGVDPANGKRFACTTGFVVTDTTQTGILTAAHCPYTLTYYDPRGDKIPLHFAGAWGARNQDVQVQVSDQALRPLFYADTAKTAPRAVTSWRNRQSMRAGDVVCHRGERTGYSCSQVELIDYAPPADLCGGPCEPTWVTVAGPGCKGGDSGGPVFLSGTAFGILKGGSYRRDGTCNFYYYMSTDFLPSGWTLLHE